MGRLENIVARNKHPWRLRKSLAFGVRSLLLLLIIIFLLFTDWGTPPEDNRPGIHVVPGKADHVRGVKLWSPPKRPAPAAAPADQPVRP